MRDVTHTELHLRNLPAPEAFQQQVRLVGVDADTHVIVYDSQGLGGCFVGSRAWWMFKVCKVIFKWLTVIGSHVISHSLKMSRDFSFTKNGV